MRDYTEKIEIKNQVINNPEWAEYIKTYKNETRNSSFKSKIYTKIPWRFLSRSWGKLHNKEMPKILRKSIYSFYIWKYEVKLYEAKNQDLRSYRNLGSFFRREIDLDGVRPVLNKDQSDLVCPVDGRILSLGRVDSVDGMIKQVKGINYSVKTLLGPNNQSAENFTSLSNSEYIKTLLKNPTHNKLYYTVIYLAPGDYHRFHSPTEWTITHRRHFPGDLFSVNPKVALWLKNLFALNERIIFNGIWKYGFLSYIPVGATLVGSMKINFDQEIYTSKPYRNSKADKIEKGIYFDKDYQKSDEKNEGVEMVRGQEIGEFNIGSTVVLLFEGPENVKFLVEEGEKVKLGIGLIEI